MTRILVTGSRDWADYDKVRGALEGWAHPDSGFPDPDKRDQLIVGDCPSGADLHAFVAWIDDGHERDTVTVHRADWDRHGRSAGPIRNQAMVDSGPDVCLAFIRNKSRGASDCVKRAEAAGIPVLIWEEP